jgi:NADH-quinone oxidoreductase subunit D
MKSLKKEQKMLVYLSAETAEAFGVSGPILRASGVKSDLRTQTDYLPYDQFEYDIPVGENGDCYDRWDVRVKEMVESAKIVLASN